MLRGICLLLFVFLPALSWGQNGQLNHLIQESYNLGPAIGLRVYDEHVATIKSAFSDLVAKVGPQDYTVAHSIIILLDLAPERMVRDELLPHLRELGIQFTEPFYTYRDFPTVRTYLGCIALDEFRAADDRMMRMVMELYYEQESEHTFCDNINPKLFARFPQLKKIMGLSQDPANRSGQAR